MKTAIISALVGTAAASSSFKVVHGGKHVQTTNGGRCITDGRGYYNNREYSRINILKDGVLRSSEFNTEGYFDRLYVKKSNGAARQPKQLYGYFYSGTTGPQNLKVVKGDYIQWRSDRSVTRSGFTICLGAPPGPPAPRKKGDLFYSVHPGIVDVTKDGRCFTDGAGTYANGERATIIPLQDMVIHSEEMHTEQRYDWLTITTNGRANRYDGDRVIRNLHIKKGEPIQWRSDGSVRRHGFTICSGARPAQQHDLWKSSDDMIIHLTPDGKCFTDGHGPYQNGERAQVTALKDGALHSTQMATQAGYDKLMINGRQFSGDRKFSAVPIKKGDTISWSSSGTTTRDGFTVCMTETVVLDACDPTNCGSWSCAEWCQCFDESVETTGFYAREGCADDGVDACACP